jgi:hypothetical protein
VDAVWNDLRVHGYRYDMRKEVDVRNEEKSRKEDHTVVLHTSTTCINSYTD